MQVVDYRKQWAGAFKAMNEAWISRYFTIEPKDRVVLDDPEGQILAKGGQVLFAVEEDRPVGCVALLKLADGGFEVAKMAVVEAEKGKGYGRALMAACVERARADGAPRLYLETNSALAPARALYDAFGFQELTGKARTDTDYARVDTWMELRL